MKVSIVMPVYNGAKFIEYAIQSIINQSYKNIEFILIDGGSSDSTMEIVERYREHFYLIVSEQDNGMYDAINKGFAKSTGTMMLWLNSDDYLFPNAVETAVHIMEKHKQVKWIKGRNAYLDKNNVIRKIACLKSYYNFFIQYGLYKGHGLGFIMQETTFWHRDLYVKAGNKVNTNYKLASDYEMWIRFSKFETLYSVNSLFGAFRQHSAQLSSDLNAYEAECNRIKKVLTPKLVLKLLKYPLYIYAMLDFKNKIYFNLEGESYFLKKIGYFQ